MGSGKIFVLSFKLEKDELTILENSPDISQYSHMPKEVTKLTAFKPHLQDALKHLYAWQYCICA
jgi:hypothetical protein